MPDESTISYLQMRVDTYFDKQNELNLKIVDRLSKVETRVYVIVSAFVILSQLAKEFIFK